MVVEEKEEEGPDEEERRRRTRDREQEREPRLGELLLEGVGLHVEGIVLLVIATRQLSSRAPLAWREQHSQLPARDGARILDTAGR